MAKNGNQKTIRLTMGQAIVKYLSVQYSEQDDERHRLIRGMFGIFGHGNVSGLAQGLYEYEKDLPYYQPCNEQSQVHTAAGYAKIVHIRLHGVGRAGFDKHADRSRRGNHQPVTG
jgi:3D-(3,5/4)-trihydroxycyclohexane-1,2-dione acylhydrolase (decyclizing)